MLNKRFFLEMNTFHEMSHRRFHIDQYIDMNLLWLL